jgi:hypothetical protein
MGETACLAGTENWPACPQDLIARISSLECFTFYAGGRSYCVQPEILRATYSIPADFFGGIKKHNLQFQLQRQAVKYWHQHRRILQKVRLETLQCPIHVLDF